MMEWSRTDIKESRPEKILFPSVAEAVELRIHLKAAQIHFWFKFSLPITRRLQFKNKPVPE